MTLPASAGKPDNVMRLRDGRALGYAEYGDPEGVPVMYFHGSPGARLGGALLHEAALRHGVRIISTDRPGHGLSDYQRNRRLLDWPGDVIELADALHLDRFAVMGVSAGGPYACACAYSIEPRLTCAILLSSGGIPDLPGVMDGMMRINRIGFRLARHAPWLLSLVMRPMAKQARRDPEKGVEPAEKGMAEADRAIVQRTAIREVMVADYREAFRQGHRGPARDVTVISRAWGFPFEDIRAKVHVWHGEDDRNASPTTARHMAGALPNCEARFFPGEGHFHFLEHLDEVMEILVRAGSLKTTARD